MICKGYARSGALQEFGGHLLVHFVVLHQQNPDAVRVIRGRRLATNARDAGSFRLRLRSAEQSYERVVKQR